MPISHKSWYVSRFKKINDKNKKARERTNNKNNKKRFPYEPWLYLLCEYSKIFKWLVPRLGFKVWFSRRHLKCYYDQKISVFPSDFESVFVWHLTGKILSFKFYPKAVFFECNLGFQGLLALGSVTTWRWVRFRSGRLITNSVYTWVSEWNICISKSPQETRFFASCIHEFKKAYRI